jgi:hypothetical protein
MQLIKTRDDYLNGSDNCAESLPGLSRRYRQILSECIDQWGKRLDGQSQNMSIENENDDQILDEETRNLELLQITNAVVHLSEIFLSEEDDSNSVLVDSQAGVGTVTAGTIRYLRFHQMADALDWINDYLPEDMDIDTVLNQNQPEYYDPLSSDDMDGSSGGTGLTPFWLLMRKLVMRGYLNDAWFLLTRHSAFQRLEGHDGSNNSMYVDPTLLEDQEAFEVIRSILLSAPLPGGRDDKNDDGRFIDEIENEEEEWVNGISMDAYKLWDSTQAPSVDDRRRNEQSHDLNIHAAMKSYKAWKGAISLLLKTNVSLRNVIKRIPMIKSCLFNILLGVKSVLQEDDSWSERLCFELLYIRPNIRTEDIHVRALASMKVCGIDFSGLGKGQLDSMVLSIMRGHAAIAIEALMDLGGRSGAALPEIMVAFLCSLLIAQNKIDDASLSYDIESELLLSASTSLLSSFATQNRSDVGIRLSTELLLPHALPAKPRIWAHMAEVLERHSPGTDAEARHLLSCCDTLVTKGCSRIKDACESICLSRYLVYRSQDKVNASVYWLCRGIEVSSKLSFTSEDKQNSLLDLSHSMCFRELVMLASRVAHSILEHTMKLHSDETDNALSFVRAVQASKIVVDTITSDDSYDCIRSDQSIRLLDHVTEIGLNVVNNEKNHVTANFVVKCIEDYNDEHGSVVTLASTDLFGYFLSIAHDILVADENLYHSGVVKTSFDVYGIQVLMSIYTQYIATVNGASHEDSPINVKLRQEISFSSMQVALAGGLKRAFIVENNELKKVDEMLVQNALRDEEPNLALLLGPSL